MRVCPDCRKVVNAIEALEIGGKYYHRACRTCARCGNIILSDKEEFKGKVYHSRCLHAGVTCVVCGKQTRRYKTNFWGQAACAEHAEACWYCGRFLSEATQGGRRVKYTYNRDGERTQKDVPLCGLCERTLVATPENIERYRREVMDIFRKNGIEGIPDDIPITLSDMVEEGKEMGRGLWGLNYSHLSPSRERYSCKITIHRNLPETLFKGVLAHELMHSWLCLYAINLTDAECEGFCNLGKYLVLHSSDAPEAEYLISWILETNTDPIYGEGFRLMKKRLDKLGWRHLMRALRREYTSTEIAER